MSQVNSTAELLENKIGTPSGQGTAVILSPQHRQDVVTWITIKGLPLRVAQDMKLESLGKAYGIPAYLRTCIQNAKVNGRKRTHFGREIDLTPASSQTVSNTQPPPLVNPIDSISSFPDDEEASGPRPDPSSVGHTPSLSRLEIERIFENAITPHLTRIGRETQSAILSAIDEASAQTLSLAEAKAAATAARAVREEIEKLNLPRHIEVQTSTSLISLSPEPRHEIFETCLKWLLAGEHLYLVGNAGTGKTHLFKQLAKAVDKQLFIVGQALTKYEFSGFIDGGGEYRGTIVRKWVEVGGILAMDELDTFGAAAVAFLNSALANGYIAFPDLTLELHPDCQVIASANTYGRGATQAFVGRNPLDAASLDRFTFLECNYDHNLEIQLYGDTPWLRYVHKVRDAVNKLTLTHIISMRAIQRGLRGYQAGFTGEQVAKASLWRGLSDDTVAKIQNLAGSPPTREQQLRPTVKIATDLQGVAA